MIVAMGTFQGNTQHCLAKCIGTVGHIIYAVLLVNYATFFGYFVVTVEAGSQQLLFGMIWHQVTGQLPGDEIIIGQILVVGMYHPIAPGPLCAVIVVLVT